MKLTTLNVVSPVASKSLLIGSDVHHFVFTVQKCLVLGSLDKRSKGVLFQHNATAGWVSSRTRYEFADKLASPFLSEV